ncbi:MAG: hypothetical protein IKL68_02895 [Clostridia bacterium]|nr:hypothetical protein [Clostridia bacterium]
MKTILKIQKDGVNTLKEEILKHSNSKLEKMYAVMGNVKESGYDVIEEALIDLKAKTHIVMGIDKKNTTKKILDNIITYSRSVYVWDNNEDAELNANVFVFEYEDEAVVLTFAGDITDSVLETDTTMYTYITYDLIKDKKEYAEFIDKLTKDIKDNVEKLTKAKIAELSENKKIFSSRQYLHNVPSIAELLGSKDNTKKETSEDALEDAKKDFVEDEELPKVELNKFKDVAFEIDLSDMDLGIEDISVGLVGETKKKETKVEKKEEHVLDLTEALEQEASLGADIEEVAHVEEEEEYVVSDEIIDLEELLFEKETVKLDKKKVEKKIKKEAKEKEENKPASKKIDLTKVSNIIMELPKKPTKGRDSDAVKVPTYIREMIPDFFDIMENSTLVEREDGKYKEVKIKLEVIDVNSGEKYMDNEAMLSHKLGQTYVTFESRKLINVNYEELDIARVIKLSKDSYHIEIIPTHMEEYNLWKKMCTNTFRGSSRQYGLM